MNPSGHAYQMQASPVMNWSLANARRVVLGSASAKKLTYSAQPSVSVKVSVNSLPCDGPLIWPHLVTVKLGELRQWVTPPNWDIIHH